MENNSNVKRFGKVVQIHGVIVVDIQGKRRFKTSAQEMIRLLDESLRITTLDNSHFGSIMEDYPIVIKNRDELNALIKEQIRLWLQSYVRYPLEFCSLVLKELLKTKEG